MTKPANPNLRVVVRMAPEIYVKLRDYARERRSTIGRLCVEGALRELEQESTAQQDHAAAIK